MLKRGLLRERNMAERCGAGKSTCEVHATDRWERGLQKPTKVLSLAEMQLSREAVEVREVTGGYSDPFGDSSPKLPGTLGANATHPGCTHLCSAMACLQPCRLRQWGWGAEGCPPHWAAFRRYPWHF